MAGRWSLFDRFESDGKRLIVAHQNDPDVGDPRGLSRRERQVAEYTGMGRSQKEISYLLGISEAAVSGAVHRATDKLGLDEATLERLSATERDVALDLLRGATVAEIARRRASSPLTVETQVKAIYAKLEVGSRVELATRISRTS